jgi:hypothetical protein
MSVLTLKVGDFWYAEEVYGPPLPKSHWHWSLWGCYEHENCIRSANLFQPKGERYKSNHISLEVISREASTHGGTCHCWRHYLLGEIENPGFPHGHEFYYVG